MVVLCMFNEFKILVEAIFADDWSDWKFANHLTKLLNDSFINILFLHWLKLRLINSYLNTNLNISIEKAYRRNKENRSIRYPYLPF